MPDVVEQDIEQASHADQEIPSECMEQDPPESLFALDRRMEELLGDIRSLLDGRVKDMGSSAAGSREQLPFMPELMEFENYKELRQNRLENILSQTIPSRRQSCGVLIAEELRYHCDLGDPFKMENMFQMLLNFYMSRMHEILQQNYLLMSRWARFCKNSQKLLQFHPAFKTYQQKLSIEFKDSLERYERLKNIDGMLKRRSREIEVVNNSNRIEGEKRGDAVIKGKTTSEQNNNQAMKGKDTYTAATGSTEKSDITPEYSISDMIVFGRSLIMRMRGQRNLNLFISRIKTMVHDNRTQIFKDYNTLKKIKPGQSLPSRMDDMDGISSYIENPPLKVPKPEDLITEFDLLTSNFQIETPIDIEDGRPFAFEIDSRFYKYFELQELRWSFLPYEEFTDLEPGKLPNNEKYQKNHSFGLSSNSTAQYEKPTVQNASQGLNSPFILAAFQAQERLRQLAQSCGLVSNENKMKLNISRRKQSDWLKDQVLKPELESWQESQEEKLYKLKEMDYELLVEFSQTISRDINKVVEFLKEKANYLWDSASKIPNSHPNTIKIQPLPQSYSEEKNHNNHQTFNEPDLKQNEKSSPISIDTLHSKSNFPENPFNFGMYLPHIVSQCAGNKDKDNILRSKKILFGNILKTNAETQLLEQEMLSLNISKSHHQRSIINPSLATIFAAHEVYSFVQLRHLHIRQLRLILQHQLNFFRSIERRINIDVAKLRQYTSFDLCVEKDEFTKKNMIAEVLSQFFKESSSTLTNQPGASNLSFNEDTRIIVDKCPLVYDSANVEVVYDSAELDLKLLEDKLLKIATIFINSGSGCYELPSVSYLDEMRYKLKSELLDTRDMTYLNFSLDRSQILLELYQCEVQFQFAKIELANIYMDLFEHSCDRSTIENIGQKLVNLCSLRPNINFGNTYFSFDYNLHCKALEAQADLVCRIFKHTKLDNRSFISRHWGDKYAAMTSASRRGSFVVPVSQKQSGDNFRLRVQPTLNVSGSESKVKQSPLDSGLPIINDGLESFSVTMHHPSIAVNITEFVPNISLIVDIITINTLCVDELYVAIRSLFPEQHVIHGAVASLWFRSAQNMWRTLEEFNFEIPRSRRLLQGLEADILLGNPFLPDILLEEHYNKLRESNGTIGGTIEVDRDCQEVNSTIRFLFDELSYKTFGNLTNNITNTPERTDILQNPHKEDDAENQNKLGVLTYINNPQFQQHGKTALSLLYKVILLQKRIIHSWSESEFWRRACSNQIQQMALQKENYVMRLSSLRFDMLDIEDRNAIEDDVEDDLEQEMNFKLSSASARPSAIYSPDTIMPMQSSGYNSALTDCRIEFSQLRFSGLAITELDEDAERTPFDVCTIDGLKSILLDSNITRLLRTLKVQMLEKVYYTSIVEVQDLLMAEIHKNTLLDQIERVFKSKDKTKIQMISNLDHNFKPFVLSWIPKKKLLRRALAQEYAKLHKLVHITETREAKREEQLKTCRGNLIDWYYKNLCEIVVEEYERAEFAKLIEYMKLQIIDSAYGKLIFKYSKIAKISDYFTSQEKGNINEIEIESIQSSETQGVTITDIHGTEKLSRLWYLPHISEIILNMNGSDKVSKVVGSPHSREWGPEAIHTWPLIFRNSLVFQCSTDLQTLIFELFQLICTSSKYVQDNSKNMDSVKSLREAEYVVTVLNSMKKDLSFQGDNAEYSRVQAYLQTRWNLWILRVKAILSTSIYGLEMEMMSAAQSELQRAHSILSLKQHQSSSYFLEKLINIPKRFIKPRLLNIPSKFVFVLGTGYSETATKICCQNVQTLEETLDREEMSVALTFGSDSQEEIAKIQSEYLLALLKLLALRREFILLMFHGKMIQNKSQLAEYLKLYKYRIIVPSVKLYHRIGAKGNASTAYLLNDKIVRATIDTEFNPIAQASFDKCQTLILQSELLREYTQQLLKYAKLFYENLLDECMGRAFKIYDSRDIPMSEDCKYAYKLSEDDYESKLQIFEQFIGDLAKAKLALLKSLRDESKNVKGVRKTELQGTYTRLAEDSLFACGKKELSQALVQFARQIVQYNEKRNIEREHFSHMIQAQMLEIIQNSERLNNYLIQEKKELEAQYKIDLRIGVAKQTWDISVAHALLAVELNDLRKARRVDEKKIRLKVIEEYEELVSELLSELNFVRNRFSEFRTNAVSEILMIMSEAKKEELKSLIINQEIPHSMKSSTEAAVFREEHISELLDQISTLKMALKKYRAFSILKENTVKNAYEKKMRKLVEDSKRAEEKLWDSYKDAEARERTLRKQLTRATKAQATAESQNESLTRLLKEEQQKVQQLLLNKPNTANDSKDPSTSINKGLKASPMDVRGLLKELDEKTRIIEQLVQKQTVTQALPTQRPTPNQRKRPASSFARFSSIASESRHKRVETTSSSSSQSSDNPLLNRPMSRALVRPKSAATVIKRPTSALGQGTQRISSTTAVGSSHVGPSAQQLQAAINEETIKKLIGISKSSQQLQSILEQHGIHFQDLKNEGNKEQPKHKERRARSAGSRSSKVSQFQRSQASIEALNASHEPISLTGRQEQNEEKDKQGQTSTDTEATAEAETSNLDRRENELKRGTENQSDIVSSSAAGNRKRFVAFVDSSPSAMVRGGQPESRRPHSAQISVSSTPRFGVGRSRPGSALRSSTTGLVVTNRPPRPSTAPPLRQHDPRTDSFD